MSVIDVMIQTIRGTKWELSPRSDIDDYRHKIDQVKSYVPGSSAVLRRFLRRELNGHGKDELAQRLFDHYLGGSGEAYNLSYDDMKHMNGDACKLGHIDLRRTSAYTNDHNPNWTGGIGHAKHSQSPRDYTGKLLWAWDNGAIGSYTVKYTGKFHVSGTKCIWGGTISYYDRFDMDPRWGWSPANPQGRSAGGERRTRIGYMLDLGWDFEIHTPPLSAWQGEHDSEIRFTFPTSL